MNVALFPSSFATHVGGVEEVTRQLAHEQVRRGDRPCVVTNRWPKTLAEREDIEGLPIRRFNFRVPERTWRQLGGRALYGGATVRRVRRELAAHAADVMHVHCVSSNAYYALWLKRLTGLPLVVTLHAELTMDATGLFRRSAFARGLMRRALVEADVVTACSQRTLSDAEGFLGWPLSGRARVIYNGANIAESSAIEPYRHSRPYVLVLARLVPQKGIDCAVRAFHRLSQDGLLSHDLLIGGDGSERETLQQLVKDLKMQQRIELLGRVDRPTSSALMNGCAFYLLPSRGDEGLPMVLVEAMASGKAVVATHVGGIPEVVVDGETGLLVERGDQDALCSALRRLIQVPELTERMACFARRLAEQFSWSAIAAQYDHAYREAIAVATCGHEATGA